MGASTNRCPMRRVSAWSDCSSPELQQVAVHHLRQGCREQCLALAELDSSAAEQILPLELQQAVVHLSVEGGQVVKQGSPPLQVGHKKGSQGYIQQQALIQCLHRGPATI